LPVVIRHLMSDTNVVGPLALAVYHARPALAPFHAVFHWSSAYPD
jgi:hypothetical protein